MDGKVMYIVFSIVILVSLLCTGEGLNCGENQLSCGGKVSNCYNIAQKCDGKRDCDTGKDEANCTATTVTKHLIVNHYEESGDNFAWLVTPIIFGIGCIYATYKCLKEGLCTIQRLRRDAARHGEQSSSSGNRHYFVLDRWSFHSLARIPTSRLGTTANIRGSTHRQLVLVTNHSFSISLSDMQEGRTPSSEGDLQSVPPPTYDEAVNAQGIQNCPGVNNDGFIPLPHEDPDLPSYNEAADLLTREDSCNSTTQLNPDNTVSESQL